MEYIEGQNIVDFCESRKLDTTARLQLFRQVCSAVQYAHQNLIVHRDIKPHNVLVTSEGTPKLLDFGIAKLLNPELAGETLAPTAGGAQLMTPEYASPEQVLGHPVTTATDVYSLGVLLYELLTNRRPCRLASRTPADIARVVCESVPARPSTAVTQLPDPAAHDDVATGVEAPPISTAGTGGRPIDADAHRLRRRLAGDLDNIVLKALSKEPDRRYASADQFSEDVRRHLAGLPATGGQSLPDQWCSRRSSRAWRAPPRRQREPTPNVFRPSSASTMYGDSRTRWCSRCTTPSGICRAPPPRASCSSTEGWSISTSSREVQAPGRTCDASSVAPTSRLVMCRAGR
jgi:serine/threonine protein kinase